MVVRLLMIVLLNQEGAFRLGWSGVSPSPAHRERGSGVVSYEVGGGVPNTDETHPNQEGGRITARRPSTRTRPAAMSRTACGNSRCSCARMRADSVSAVSPSSTGTTA